MIKQSTPRLGINLFTVTLTNNKYIQEELMETNVTSIINCVVTSDVKRKWYKLLLQYTTFGWYKAPYYYHVKLIAKV